MKSYLNLAHKYLKAHKKKTRYAIMSIIMSVALIVGIFSMLDSSIKYEKQQVIKDEGYYHIYLKNPDKKEIDYIKNRIDVKNTGSLKDFGYGALNDSKCSLLALDESFLSNLNVIMTEGKYPTAENEIMLEKWAMEKSKPALKIGDNINVSLPDGVKQMTIAGVIEDWGETKAASIPFVILSIKASEKLTPKTNDFFVLFKDGVNIGKAEKTIKKALSIAPERIIKNERLLALMLQSKNNRVLQLYAIGAALFILVLITAVVMIYNTFNISVMERVRNFGLLRCIGASKAQIKSLVRREAFIIALKGIPIGVLTGIFLTSICSAVLKYFNSEIYGDIPLISISIFGIALGVVIGFLTVFIASMLPASKASKVSAINAVTGNNEFKISKRKKRGILSKLLNIEIALGVTSATNKKKTLILMSLSIAFSVIMFLGFNVLVNPTNMGMKGIRPFSPDITLSSDAGISEGVYKNLLSLNSIKRVYGRKTSIINADLGSASTSTDNKKDFVGVNASLVSYDDLQLKWADKYLTSGPIDVEYLNSNNGVILVTKNAASKGKVPQIGDKVLVNSTLGIQELNILGIMKTSEGYSDDKTKYTIITSEKIFDEITDDNKYKVLDIQLKKTADQKTVDEIKKIAGEKLTFHDIRQLNAKERNSFLTIAVFIYGFVGVIALISILNLINTMNTSIAAKVKKIGVMRAVGMSGKQLTVMVLTEAIIYNVVGCALGCILGILLQKAMVGIIISEWNFPAIQVVMIFAVCIITSALAVIGPIKKIKAKSIYETIGSL